MRFYIYLAFFIVMQILTYFILTPFLPLFATMQFGSVNNRNDVRREPRLPWWLNWFQTPDNSLWGDSGWQNEHCPNFTSYWGIVKWLYRNSLYGLSWGTLGAPMTSALWLTCDMNSDMQIGTFRAHMGSYWQYKSIRPIFNTGRALNVEFGWVLDPYCKKPDLWLSEPRALFTASIRFTKIK